MKRLLLLFSATLLMVNFTSCNKDPETDPDIVSQIASQTVSSYTIKWVRLENIPMTDANNDTWDTGIFGGSDPDIFFKLYDNSNNVIYTSDGENNVSSSDLPITWDGVNTTIDFKTAECSIRFYDKDDGLDDSDVMAWCEINNSHLTPGNSSFVWYNNEIVVRFTIGLSWSYTY